MDRDEGDEMLPLLVLLGTIAGAWYLLIVRPQKDLQTRHGRLVEQLQVGDHVLTVGGIYGRVTAIEGSSAVLELAPGLTSRIATDGIARIVHGGEAALPTATTGGAAVVDAAAPNFTQARDDDMHRHPHSDEQLHAAPAHPQQHFAAPAYVAPPTPYAAPPAPAPYAAPVAIPAHPTPVQASDAQQQPRFAPAGSSIPTFEPRPWGDVAPVNAPAPVHAPAHAAAQPPQYAPHHAVAVVPQPVPLHQPFAPAPAMHTPVFAQQPVITMTAPVLVAGAPIHAPQPAMHHPQHVVAPLAEPVSEERGQRHSRAPKGMGSTLRLDDPSLSDTMDRARQERAGLAVEYRKLAAPLVEVGPAPDQHQLHPQHAPAPQLIGHDPGGVSLYAAPGATTAQPIMQYPMPAHPVSAHGVPRPVVTAPTGNVDPAFTSRAFQRPTPYAPDPALQPARVAEQEPGLTHA